MNPSRRKFLQFLGRTSVVLGSTPLLLSTTSCNEVVASEKPFPFKGIPHSLADDLVLADGLTYDVLISWDDPISSTDRFGFNNDFTAFIPFDTKQPNDGMLWVNHEYLNAMFVSQFNFGDDINKKTNEQVQKEMYSVGGTLVRIKKNSNHKWQVVQEDHRNRRLTGQTMIPFAWPLPIEGATEAMGTFANCSGGVTPWGTILTCEENYDSFYGETVHENGTSKRIFNSYYYGWDKHYNNPPEHYGWVVEVNPLTGQARKLVALGRCAHECATMHQTSDGRLVVYTGDDSNDECLYKFISSKPGSLEEGILYVANTEKGEWISLDYASQPALQENFSDQTEVLVRLREAAKIVGGTPLNRPEDIEIDPITGHVLISLTNNKPKGDYLGSILKIEEDNADKTSLTFKSDIFLAGGEETGFACPDNMAFDPKGNLWITSDISGSAVGKSPYEAFGNNGLFLVPAHGPDKGKVLQIASAPVDAELTGPYFAPDGKTLFLSVQHPGENSKSMTELSSNWPNGGDEIPRPSVVAISGAALDALMELG